MAQQVNIASFEKDGERFKLFFRDGSWMYWNDQIIMEDYIDNGPDKPNDRLIRGILRLIRAADPTFTNIVAINNIDYELPEVRVVI